MAMMQGVADNAPTCPEIGCGLPAAQVSGREVGDHIHELTGTCKRGHLWTTKWFAQRGA